MNDVPDELLDAIRLDEELSRYIMEGRLHIEGDRAIWTKLKIRGLGDPMMRKFVWGPREPHTTKGRTMDELKAPPISIRLTHKVLKERKQVFNELLRNYGVYTVKNLGEFDREVYVLGLGYVLERAHVQSDTTV